METNKYGNVKKCPACGALINQMSAKCEACGHEFSDIKANDTVQNLLLRLEKVDSSSSDKEKVVASKIQIIQNYPVPNTKEDLLEMLTLCAANADASALPTSLRNAWQAKTNQLISKVEITLKGDKDATQLISKISRSREKKKKKTLYIILIITIILLGGGIGWWITSSNLEKELGEQNNEIIALKNQASSFIQDQEYDSAFVRIEEINHYLVQNNISREKFSSLTGDVYLKLVIALIREDDIEGAAMVGLDYREKLNNEQEWLNSQIFKILVQECEAQNIDDSPLR